MTRALFVRGRGLACLFVLAQLALPCVATQTVRDLVRSERYADALELAGGETRPLERARARLHVLHHAGDLAGALQAGMDGLREHPDDLELLAGVGDLSLSLHLGALARESVMRLEATIDATALAPETRTWWKARADGAREQMLALTAREQAGQRAVARARWTVIVCGAGLVAGWLAFARLDAAARPSE